MNQFSVDSVRAFELMVQQWHKTNTPVRVVAEQIIDVYTADSADGLAARRFDQDCGGNRLL